MITTVPVKDNKSLGEAIAFLENKQRSELGLLKEHFEFTKEQLNPINIIKDGFHDAMSSKNITATLAKGALGIASGFLAKKFVIGTGGGLVSKLAGSALQTGVSALALRAPDSMEKINDIKEGGISLLLKGLKKLKIK